MIVLDTHALVWWVKEPERLSAAAHDALSHLGPDGPGLVSSMSFWEVALKVRAGKLGYELDMRDFWADVSALGAIEVVPVDVPTWLANVDLDWSHGDPADRTIVALAKQRGLPLVTADRKIRDYYPDTIW